MKKIIFVLYVGCVLLFSAFARAETQFQTQVNISHVSVNENLEMTLGGSLPNPCYDSPSAMLSKDDANPHTLVLRLSSPIPMSACVSRVKDYTAVVNLPLLARASALVLDDKAVYLVKTEGHEFALQVSGADLR